MGLFLMNAQNFGNKSQSEMFIQITSLSLFTSLLRSLFFFIKQNTAVLIVSGVMVVWGSSVCVCVRFFVRRGRDKINECRERVGVCWGASLLVSSPCFLSSLLFAILSLNVIWLLDFSLRKGCSYCAF